MTSADLQALMASASPPILIHVLPSEVFSARRIPGSRSACVYEVSFPEQVQAINDEKEGAMVVYGAGGGSHDARVAAEKLAALGFNDVRVFAGGLAAWEEAGLPFESDGEPAAATAPSGRYVADTNDSVIRWTGRNLFNHHSGTVALAGGEIVIREGEVVSARLHIDMNTIRCEDITDVTMNRMLVTHLCSDDFFDVSRHPEAVFTAIEVTPISGHTEGTPTHLLRGDFTLRDTTRTLEFPVQIASADGIRLTAQGVVDLDRTEFGSLYGSGRFFRFLGKHLVNDHIHLHLKIHADLYR